MPKFVGDVNSLAGIHTVMARDAAETHRRILQAAYALFYREGFERTGVDTVAAEARVTKRTLYNHFSSKDDLIAEVIAGQGELAAREVQRWCGDKPQNAEDLIETVFNGLKSWSASPEWRGSGFTRVAMELAWAPGHPARRAAAAQKRAVESALSGALAEAGSADAGRLARVLVVLIEGAMTLRLIHGDPVWIDAAKGAAQGLVASSD